MTEYRNITFNNLFNLKIFIKLSNFFNSDNSVNSNLLSLQSKLYSVFGKLFNCVNSFTEQSKLFSIFGKLLNSVNWLLWQYNVVSDSGKLLNSVKQL